MDANNFWYGLTTKKPTSSKPPKILIIGAGSRGNAYARAVTQSTRAIVSAVAEPINHKRKELGRKYIWKGSDPQPDQEFADWRGFVKYELARRERAGAGQRVEDGVDAVFICTLDEQHATIATELSCLNLHIMCEKPLATTLDDCLNIYSSLLPSTDMKTSSNTIDSQPRAIFGIGHVLRYSPHNMLLRQLLLEDGVIGDIISIEHTEPVGWWHFSHSYVRGNWRKESTTAPSLLTKSCHDIDLLLWLLCSPPSPQSTAPPHLPSKISSSGHLNYFREHRKPPAAGAATNCLSCPVSSSCNYSAPKIYLDRFLTHGQTGWPVNIVVPEIETCYTKHSASAASKLLLTALAEDYDATSTPAAEIDARPWFGRCVWESANDVCDDQVVTMTWDDEDDPLPPTTDKVTNQGRPINRHAKTAIFHMIAHTQAQCERRGRVYGTTGELTYDSHTIRVVDFASGIEKVHHPEQMGGGHGGGDDGLAQGFVSAVEAVKKGEMGVEEAQRRFLGCSLEEVVRSHAVVFAAEEARREGRVVDWRGWWRENLEGPLGEKMRERGKGRGV